MNDCLKANGSHIQSWENIFDQASSYISVYIFVRHLWSGQLYFPDTVCGGVSGWVTFGTPLGVTLLW